MKLARRLILAASLVATLGAVAPLASAAADPSTHSASAVDQVHQPRDVFTDGANLGARDPFLDGAHSDGSR